MSELGEEIWDGDWNGAPTTIKEGNKHRTPLQFVRHGYAVDSQNYLSILLLDDTFHLRYPSTSYYFFEEGWPSNIIMQIGPQELLGHTRAQVCRRPPGPLLIYALNQLGY